MSHSELALKIFAAKECGIINSNAQFWKNFSKKEIFEEKISENPDFKKKYDELAKELNSYNCKIEITCLFDDDFPVINQKVKNSGEKPYLLFYYGDLSLLKDLNKNVAVIGVIDPDEKIIEREKKIIQELVNNDLIVVSGLAKGCDTIAHEDCLEVDGKTIAILPTQINKIYPAENRELAEDIVNKGGLLLSEYNEDPKNRYEALNRFICRDRLQAMFAKAVILIASPRKGEGDSGSRHAMEAAKKYGIQRYVMYNAIMDENNRQFGLNKDLFDKENVKLLSVESIKYISKFTNPNLKKNQKDDCIQQIFKF